MGHHEVNTGPGSGDSDGKWVKIQPMSTPIGVVPQLEVSGESLISNLVWHWQQQVTPMFINGEEVGAYSRRRAAMSWPLRLLGLGGVGVIEVVGAVTKLFSAAPICSLR